MTYAEAINRIVQEAIETSRNYGRLLAQAGIGLEGAAMPDGADIHFVREGYEEQLRDYPNG